MLQPFDERNRDLVVNIDGELIHRDRAGVSPFDSAVQGGDAVWEGLRLYRGRIFKLREHLDRLRGSALALAFEEIPTHEMYALVDISEQMMEDSEFNLETELQQEVSEQFAVTEGLGFVNGTASGQPEGFLVNSDVGSTNSGSATTIADSAGQANGLIDLYHGLKTAYAVQGTWLLSRSTLGDVRKLKDGQNNYIWQPGLASGIPNTILGSPYVEVPDMPAVAADAFPIAFGNWRRAYVIVDRITLSILRDPFTQATSGNIRFVARRRVGGQTVLAEAIRKLKVST